MESGTFSGHSVTRSVDLTGWPGVGGRHTAVHWSVTATKTGTLLIGNITFFLERWEVDCAGAVNSNGHCPEAGANDGTYQISYDFTARRVR